MLDIAKIKNQLPQGAQAEIAKRAKVHFSKVHRVLNGKQEDTHILNVIADYLTEIRKNKKNAIDRLTSLID